MTQSSTAFAHHHLFQANHAAHEQRFSRIGGEVSIVLEWRAEVFSPHGDDWTPLGEPHDPNYPEYFRSKPVLFPKNPQFSTEDPEWIEGLFFNPLYPPSSNRVVRVGIGSSSLPQCVKKKFAKRVKSKQHGGAGRPAHTPLALGNAAVEDLLLLRNHVERQTRKSAEARSGENPATV